MDSMEEKLKALKDAREKGWKCRDSALRLKKEAEDGLKEINETLQQLNAAITKLEGQVG